MALELNDITTNSGDSLTALSHKSPLLVVFLRHKGCTFCRQTLSELEQRRIEVEAAGVKIVLVHMIEDDNEAEMFFARWRLHDVPRISDPRQEVYERFGLKRGTLSQVAGVGIWWPGLKAIFSGNFVGKPVGDVFQLPGTFIVHQGKVEQSFRADDSASHADFAEMVRGCCDGCD